MPTIKSKKSQVQPKRKRSSKSLKIKKSKYGAIGTIKENEGIVPIAKHFQKFFLKSFPTEKDDHFFWHTYVTKTSGFAETFNFYIELYEFLDISLYDIKLLRDCLYKFLNSDSNRTKEKFKKKFKFIVENVLEKTDKKIMIKLNLLHNIEFFRLCEAMKCLNNECNLAAVVMAVSAVEHRLHRLLEKKNKKLYKSGFEQSALGGIIELFRRNSRYTDKKYDKFKKILPEKHNHLMEILNTYRIFSAHAKSEFISSQTAKSIVSFSFLLLIDPDLRL